MGMIDKHLTEKRPMPHIEGAGAGAGIMVAPVLVWICAQFGVEMPAEVAASLGGLLGVLSTFISRPYIVSTR
jgi:hypothetical protein